MTAKKLSSTSRGTVGYDSLAHRLYASKRLKGIVNDLPRWIGYPAEAGLMLTILGLDGIDRMVRRR